MKTVSDDLRAILGGSQFFMADCYSFTLRDGTVARYTSADTNIVDQATGNHFVSSGPYFERSKVKFQTGVTVDELDLSVSAKGTDLLDGAPWLSALRAGVLDGALVQLDRAFMAEFGDTSAGLLNAPLPAFSGILSRRKRAATSISCSRKSGSSPAPSQIQRWAASRSTRVKCTWAR